MEQLANRVVAVILGSFVIVFFVVVGIGLFLQRQWFPTIGAFIIFDLLFFLVGLPIAVLGAALFFAIRGRTIDVGPQGTYLQRLHRLIPLAPLAPVTPKVAGSTVTEIKPNVPRLGDLIRQGLLTEQSTEGVKMLVGARQDESLRYERMPGVIAITGMQNVGKTVTMVMLILIALFQGAAVVICDTHNTKARSLYKKVVALTGLVTFALTEEEVLREVKANREALHRRKMGEESSEPRVMVIDETNSLVRARSQELQDELVTMMEEVSQEGQGYGLHLVCAIHDMSNSGIGDARLRGFFNWVFCHRMEAGQSKFIEAFKGKYGKLKTSAVIASLPQGHVMVRDEVNEIEYLIIPYGDSKDVLMARQYLGVTTPARPEFQIEPQTERLSLPEAAELQIQNEVKQPVEQIAYGNGFSMQPEVLKPKPEASEEDKRAMMEAYVVLARVKGQEHVQRKDILEYCGWTNYKWPVVKAYCDERGIGR